MRPLRALVAMYRAILKNMDYQEFRAKWDAARGPVLDLVRRVEDRLTAKEVLGEAALVSEFPHFPFSPRIWRVWLGNTAKLQGVKRLDRFPYATHPTRMALICCWLIDEDKVREDSGVLAIVHDYLEEGDGLTKDGIDAMRRQFPEEAAALVAGVVLSEPIVDYASLGRSTELSFWRRVAYVLQAKDAIEQLGDQAFANAALADKLDNLHDLDYIALDPRMTPEKRAMKLAHRLGYFRFVARELGAFAAPALRSMLERGITNRTYEFGVSQGDVDLSTDDLAERARGKRSVLTRMTKEYQSALGLRLSASSI